MEMSLPRLPRLGRGPAFWSSAAVFAVVLGGSAMASPLYGVYQASWHFSSTTLTTVFAVYAFALLVVLLVAGSVSDHVGRRPMMAVGLLAEAGAAALFLTAHGLGELYGARILQGVATGAAAGAVGAALLELQPPSRPTLGPTVNSTVSTGALAVGALGAGALIQYAPAPTRLVFWVLMAASAVGLGLLALMPEPGTRRRLHAAVFRPRAGIPPAARRSFVAALPALLAAWALGGLYFSLGPSVIGQLAGSHDVVWGGLVIFLLAGSGAVAALALRQLPPRRGMLGGSVVLAVGSGGTLVAVVGHSAAGFLVATAVAGIGFGISFLGAFRHLASLARPDELGALMATIYVVSYLAFSLPVIAAGVAATSLGLHDTAIIYAAVVTTLALLAAADGLTTRRASGAALGPQARTEASGSCPERVAVSASGR